MLKNIRINAVLKGLAIATALLSLVLLAPTLLKPGFPAGHDIAAHVTYTYLFDQAIHQGQFPVRWVEWVQDGHSQPLFNFYQVGLYYITQFVHIFIPELSVTFNTTILLIWWVGALLMFLFLRRWGILPAILGGLVYAFSPYIILDIFVRNAYPELAAISFFPGLLWSIDRFLVKKQAIHISTIAFFTFLILICHLPSFLIFIPVLVGYCLFLWLTKQTSFKRLLWLAPIELLGLCMASFYVFPALFELNLIKIQQLTKATFDFHRHFVYPQQWMSYVWGYGGSGVGLNDGMSFQIGISQWLIMILAFLSSFFVQGNKRLILLFWLAVAGFAMFIMTHSSVQIWELIKPLEFIQFPWRFFMLITIACSVLAALLMASIKQVPLQAIFIIFVAIFQFQLYNQYLKPARFIPLQEMNINNPNWRYEPNSGTEGFIESGYNPVQIQRVPLIEIGRWTITQGQGTIKEKLLKDDQLVLETQNKEPMQLTINSHFFPGWKVWIDGHETQIVSKPDYYYLDVAIPPGTHTVEAKFTNTPIREFSNWLTFLSLIIWAISTIMVLVLVSVRNTQKTQTARSSEGQ